MAAESVKPKSRKKQPIEPLDWSAMSQSPALKGMVSFLEVTPEEIRRQHGVNGAKDSPSDTLTGSEALPVSVSIIGSDSRIDTLPEDNTSSHTIAEHESKQNATGGHHPNNFLVPISEPRTDNDTSAVSETHTGSESCIDSEFETSSIKDPELKRPIGNGPGIIPGLTSTEESQTGGASPTGSESHTVSETHTGTVSSSDLSTQLSSESRTGGSYSKRTYFVGSDQYPRPQRRMFMLQGEVVWQNRKIRKCVLAQDAHSQGEDALFSAMWNTAKPNPADPTGSRTLRIGYAELAQKSRMHRSNVRINIGGLRAKLAIEILDEHDSRDVMPRLYRLYSYKEILDRRKAAGLEYVIRKKSVVFVTEAGEPIVLPGLVKAGTRKGQKQSNANNADAMPPQEGRAEQLDLDVRQISDALSQHWPVDEAAAQQLLRQCRSIRRDAEIDEIVFFINEKLQIALTSRNIKNPTGLILATVPQCFEGSTFLEFRRRRNESLRLSEEEADRKRQQERELQAWIEEKLQGLRAIVSDESQPESAREKARRELKQYGG